MEHAVHAIREALFLAGDVSPTGLVALLTVVNWAEIDRFVLDMGKEHALLRIALARTIVPLIGEHPYPVRLGSGLRPVRRGGVLQIVIQRVADKPVTELTHIADAQRRVGLKPSLSQRGQEDGHQQSDDRDHHQQFDQGEAGTAPFRCSAAHGLTLSDPTCRGCR